MNTIDRDAEERLLDQTREFAQRVVVPGAVVWERERRIGREAVTQAAALGLTRLQVPATAGGLDYSFGCKVRVADILGAADFAFTMSLINTHNVAAKLARDAPASLAQRYVPQLIAGTIIGCTALSEPSAGSDFAAIKTMATRSAHGWSINGEKAWISNASDADVIVTYAQTQVGAGGRGIACFVVDATRAGFVRLPAFALAGQHAIGAGGFRLEHYQARDDEMLHPPGQAFKTALGSINGARTYIAAMSCGMVDAALRIVSDYGERRHSFSQALADHQGWRWRVAEAATDLAAARLLVQAAIGTIEAGQDAQLASAQAKLFANRMAERHLPILAQAMGAEGLREHYPFGRHLIGARVASFVDGSVEMLLERICAVQRHAHRQSAQP